jgi:hypothetical protein
MANQIYINPRTDSQKRKVFADINVCFATFTTDIAGLDTRVTTLEGIVGGDTATADNNIGISQFVYLTGAGTIDLADASALATGITVGAAPDAITAAASGTFLSTGVVTRAAWGLTEGARYFLSGVTPGEIVTAPDDTATGAVAISVGFALSATELFIEIQPPLVY